MKVKELKEILEKYPQDTVVLIAWISQDDETLESRYFERELDEQDIVDSNFDWSKRLIIEPHSLDSYV